MIATHRRIWLGLSLLKFLLGLLLKRRPNVLNNLLRIAFGLTDWKRGGGC